MSIAGIAKEVTTIAASAIVFGDELTPLNITGVGITIAGRSFLPCGTFIMGGKLIGGFCQASACTLTTNTENQSIPKYR